jgi:hypothetical protein
VIVAGFPVVSAGYPRVQSDTDGGGATLIIAAIVAVCIVLAVLAFLLPRMSWWPQRGVDKALGSGQRAASSLPGKAGELAQKPFETSRKAANKSAAKGREGRSKMPT